MNYVGFAMQAYGALKGGADAKNAADRNASIMRTEGDIVGRQGYEEEAMVRRRSAAELGNMRAAIAQSGAGNGGSVARVYDQSAIDAELDALNVRYKAQLTRWGYRNQAFNLQQLGSDQRNSAYIGSAASLLRSYGNYSQSVGPAIPQKVKVS